MNRIKELRKQNNLTLKQLGNAVGIKDNTLSQYENGKRNPNNEILDKLAKYFNVSFGYLAGSETDFNIARQTIKSLLLDMYITSNIGNHRDDDEIVYSLPYEDSTYNALLNLMIDPSEFDISYYIDTFIRVSNPNKFIEMVKSLEVIDNDLINKYKYVQADKEDSEFKGRVLSKIIDLFINPLTTYIIKNKSELLNDGDLNNIIPFINVWLKENIDEISPHRLTKGQEELESLAKEVVMQATRFKWFSQDIEDNVLKDNSSQKQVKKEISKQIDDMIEALKEYKNKINKLNY